jgi:hypothetical protein
VPRKKKILPLIQINLAIIATATNATTAAPVVFLLFFSSLNQFYNFMFLCSCKVEGKAIPVTGRGGP